MTNINSLEDRVRELEDRIERLVRDQEDTLENLDRSNFGTSLSNDFNNLKKLTNRINISANGDVTINSDNVTIHTSSGDISLT